MVGIYELSKALYKECSLLRFYQKEYVKHLKYPLKKESLSTQIKAYAKSADKASFLLSKHIAKADINVQNLYNLYTKTREAYFQYKEATAKERDSKKRLLRDAERELDEFIRNTESYFQNGTN